jgi:hypothetical protein
MRIIDSNSRSRVVATSFSEWTERTFAILLSVLLTGSVVVVLPAAPAAASNVTCGVSAKLVPSCGVLTGVATYRKSGQTWEQSVAAYESKVGTVGDVLHNYHNWKTIFPDTAEKARAAKGQKLLISWLGTRDDGSTIRWADIAAGKEDAVIDAQAKSVKAFGQPIWINFQNEPEALVNVRGTAAEFVAAWRHIHDRFVSAGATNAVWTIVFMGVADSQSYLDKTVALYPGDAYVDWIGWDPYNRAACYNTSWKDFRATVKPFYNWLMLNGHADKPFMLAEYGSIEDAANPQARANWFTGAGDALTNNEFPNLKVLSYFDHPAPPATCDWRIETSSTTLTSFKAFTARMKTFSTTPITAPGVPTSVRAAAAPGAAVVNWTAPTFTGGGLLTGYVVTANPGGIKVTVPGPNPVTSAAVTGLTPGVAYTFTVAATNSSGTGTASTVSASVTPVTSRTRIPDPASGGWKLNGNAVLGDGGVRLTDVATTEARATAWWPTPVASAKQLAVTFTSTIDGGQGADGTAMIIGNAAAGATATSLGRAGGGLGWSGTPGVAVALDTYRNGTDPSSNFVGLATGWESATPKNLTWQSTRDLLPSLRGSHKVSVVVSGGKLYIAVDGTQALATAATLPASTLVGFSAGQGGRTDRHLVTNVKIGVA